MKTYNPEIMWKTAYWILLLMGGATMLLALVNFQEYTASDFGIRQMIKTFFWGIIFVVLSLSVKKKNMRSLKIAIFCVFFLIVRDSIIAVTLNLPALIYPLVVRVFILLALFRPTEFASKNKFLRTYLYRDWNLESKPVEIVSK